MEGHCTGLVPLEQRALGEYEQQGLYPSCVVFARGYVSQPFSAGHACYVCTALDSDPYGFVYRVCALLYGIAGAPRVPFVVCFIVCVCVFVCVESITSVAEQGGCTFLMSMRLCACVGGCGPRVVDM